ncbi:MAG: methyltransferase domain-containing protein [Flavobacterium sp.]|nr:methyltransferase domain-containing protein [Flavobacterium sp.]
MTNTKLENIVVHENWLQSSGSYWKYMTPAFEKHLLSYLPIFEKYRTDIGIAPTTHSDWEQLPFGAFANDASWKWRRQSLAILQHHLKQKKLESVLEIGSWNGWLTKYLAKRSEMVVAADYFTCPFDGIGNLKELASNIKPIQCNVETIKVDFKAQSFDLIVLNHCLTYTESPCDFIQNLIPLLKDGGAIISLGNTFYRNPKRKILQNKTARENYLSAYHRELYIQPVKGYMDLDDFAYLKNNGFTMLHYPKMWIQNFIAKIYPYKPFYKAILYQNRA